MAGVMKKPGKELLDNVPEEYVFWSCTGHVLRNMKELGEELGTMPGESYFFHANAEKNDFANWVRDIIKDKTLARNLQKAASQAQAAGVVAGRISYLSRK